ncbi:hypothetical protein [Paenibacillus sp. JCM 10914]|uniref:hypothetical protein n=1 Tax=Paenibacillus sp. JCM 10914 TaxID=1236974 RepID=UPI0003CC3E76|nr:hypothetical protein [Paenibacillus sp. JCM 10914]GAE09613.1 hypothetical protein JCM10914_5983 [Paenibacillus sp. JCM 10914]
MHHVRKAVEARLNKTQSREASIKAHIDYLINELRETETQLLLLAEEKEQLESFLNGEE